MELVISSPSLFSARKLKHEEIQQLTQINSVNPSNPA